MYIIFCSIILDGEGDRKSEKEFDRTIYWKKFGKFG